MPLWATNAIDSAEHRHRVVGGLLAFWRRLKYNNGVCGQCQNLNFLPNAFFILPFKSNITNDYITHTHLLVLLLSLEI